MIFIKNKDFQKDIAPFVLFTLFLANLQFHHLSQKLSTLNP